MAKLGKMIHWIQTINSFKLMVFLLLTQMVIHVKYSNYPPVGYHLWRQTMGLSVARNFYEEDMNILKPRVDSRGQYPGITGMEFPLVNYAIAITYYIFGFNHLTSRYVVLGLSCMALIFCFFFFDRLFHNQLYGISAAVLLMFSPLFCYYSFVVLPDVPSLAFLFGALFFLLEWGRTDHMKYFLGFTALLCLAGLIKISALLCLPYVVLYIGKRRKLTLSMVSCLCIGIMVILTWYIYARSLSHTYHNSDFLLTTRLSTNIPIVVKAIKKVVLQWLPEMYLSYAESLLFLIGLYVLFKNRIHLPEALLFIRSYGIGVILFMVTMLPMFIDHDYYMLPSLPLLIGISTCGVYWLIQRVLNGHQLERVLLLLLIMTIPIIGSIRALGRFERGIKQLPRELLSLESYLSQVIPDKNARVMITDNSTSIKLYFANRKGWNIQENIGVEQFNDMIDHGAKYLISDSRTLENRAEISRKLHLLANYHSFSIFKLN